MVLQNDIPNEAIGKVLFAESPFSIDSHALVKSVISYAVKAES